MPDDGSEEEEELLVSPSDPQPLPAIAHQNLSVPAPAPVKRRRIRAIGVELEGGWNGSRLPPTEIKHDGSVRVRADVTGEVVSQPYPTLDLVVKWMRDNYPTHVDVTCGLHVHVSTNELNYSRLMEDEFKDFFEVRMVEFSQYLENKGSSAATLFRRRLAGENIYCQKKFIPVDQIFRTERYGDTGTHPRYAQLNFCYTRHGTLECRLFPCFPDVEDGVEAVKRFYGTVFDYLGRFKNSKEEVVSVTLPLSE